MTTCNDCGGTVIEYDTSAGNGFCVKCGTVVEENTIVSEVTFGETSSGAAMVQGSYVAQGSTHARMSGPFGNRGGHDSREQSIAIATRKIQSIASILRVSEVVCLAATRLYTLAVEHKFTKGRKSLNVVAVCLYVACRQKETRNYMLIDFSDLLQVNVFELGHTYLQLVQTLNLRLPLVDPSHYISRFSALLEFGEDTHKVAHDAVRLVQRFDRDWMTKGRRPAGICGAALLLAARMNNFRRSVEEVVQVVKIADTTLKKRLEEFAKTSSAALSVVDFRRVWLEEEMDPPAFTKGKEKEEKENRDERTQGQIGNRIPKGKHKRKREQDDETGGEEYSGQDDQPPMTALSIPSKRQPVDPSLFNQGILAGAMDVPQPIPQEGTGMAAYSNIDPTLLPQHNPPEPSSPTLTPIVLPPTTAIDETADSILVEEVSIFLESSQGAQLSQALAEVEERRLARMQETVVDELIGLDEEELDRLLLTEDEVRVKERVWVEMNREYLEAIAAKAERDLTSAPPPKSRKRRNTAKPRDATTPHASTAAESVRQLIKKNPKYSKRINYDALKELFVESRSMPANSVTDADEKVGRNLYAMDDESDTEGMTIVEEEGGGIGVPLNGKDTFPLDAEGDEDAYGEEDLEGGLDAGEWDDVYEQEV